MRGCRGLLYWALSRRNILPVSNLRSDSRRLAGASVTSSTEATMSKNPWLIHVRALYLSALCALSICLIVTATAAAKPNVIFLFADDQRADTIAALGNPHIKT